MSFSITNSGSRAGAEVAQVYAVLPENTGRRSKRLIGWRKEFLQPGERRLVSIPVDRKLLSVFSEDSSSWSLKPGTYKLIVGVSSADVRLQDAVNIF